MLCTTILFLRTLLFRLGFCLLTVVYGSLSLPCFILPRRWRFLFVLQWARLVVWWLWLSCGVRYEVRGKENIPKTPCVILSKHSSAWETVAFSFIFHMPAIVSKKSLLKIPFFGWMLALFQPIAIDRKKTSSAMKQVLSQGKKCLQQGRHILIFPEGTRVPPGERREFKPGGALLAKRNRHAILPVSHNAGLFWSDKSFLIRPGKVIVTIGQLMQTHDHDIETLNDITTKWIEANTHE